MTCSFDTMLTTLFASLLLLLIACILFANSKRILAVGCRTLAFISVLAILRLLLPIEFNFAIHINVNRLFSEFILFFRQPHQISPYITFYPWYTLLAIWGIGILVQSIKYVQHYRKTQATIQLFGTPVSNQAKYADVLTSVCQVYQVKQQFSVYEIPSLPTPMIFSMRKPSILFPAGNHYSEEELTFIFRHEITHFTHHHLLYQFFVQLFSVIYWWNPLNSYIRKQIDALLEMNVDHSFSKSAEETTQYLNCLLQIKKQAACDSKNHLSNTCSLSMNSVSESVLEKRFRILASSSKRHSLLSAVLIISSLTVFVFSYIFTLKALATPKNTADFQTFTLTDENAYAISRSDGTFDLYLYGEYLETVDSLKYYDSSLPVYSETETLPDKDSLLESMPEFFKKYITSEGDYN